MELELKQVYKLFESLKPLNFGRRLIFQKYCKYLIENKKIEECDVKKFLLEDFLNDDSDDSGDSDDDDSDDDDSDDDDSEKELKELKELKEFKNKILRRDKAIKNMTESIRNGVTNTLFLYFSYKFMKNLWYIS